MQYREPWLIVIEINAIEIPKLNESHGNVDMPFNFLFLLNEQYTLYANTVNDD